MTATMTDTTTEITMPQLSDAMEEGTIVKWLIDDGQPVAIGDELVEIETDKATMAHPAEAEGVLQIVVPEGESAAVGAPIARVGAAVAVGGEAPAAPPSADAPASVTNVGAGAVDGGTKVGAEAVTGSAGPLADGSAASPAGDAAVGARRDSWFADTAVDVAAGVDVGAGAAGVRAVVATPVARRYARVHGVVLGDVVGTGPQGRIVKSDVLRAAGLGSPESGVQFAGAGQANRTAVLRGAASPADAAGPVDAAGPAGPTSPARPAGPADTRQVPTRLQQVIARRMVESKTTVPHFQVQTEVAMDEAIALRAKLKSLVGEGEKPPSFNDLIVRACAVALRGHPLANGSWVDEQFELHERINVGIAVAAEGGLVVPTIFDTDQKSLGQIGAESRRLAAAVRDGSVSPVELSGGTFTVSNLGMYGMTAITPVINPPQAAILGVGAMRATLARDGEEIVDRSLLTLTLSCDHRILYGADAARFLAGVKDLLEQPLRIAL